MELGWIPFCLSRIAPGRVGRGVPPTRVLLLSFRIAPGRVGRGVPPTRVLLLSLGSPTRVLLLSLGSSLLE